MLTDIRLPIYEVYYPTFLNVQLFNFFNRKGALGWRLFVTEDLGMMLAYT